MNEFIMPYHPVVHASPFVGCVHEDLLEDFLDVENGLFRGTRRIPARD